MDISSERLQDVEKPLTIVKNTITNETGELVRIIHRTGEAVVLYSDRGPVLEQEKNIEIIYREKS